jgi:hypothetical protein
MQEISKTCFNKHTLLHILQESMLIGRLNLGNS